VSDYTFTVAFETARQGCHAYVHSLPQCHIFGDSVEHARANIDEAMTLAERWHRRATDLKTQTYALYLACRHARTPWHAKALALVVVAYAFSPIDLFPDFIPVLGYLDDLLLLPLGVVLVLKLVPAEVMAECRLRAQQEMAHSQSIGRWGVVIVVGLWIIALALAGLLASRLMKALFIPWR